MQRREEGTSVTVHHLSRAILVLDPQAIHTANHWHSWRVHFCTKQMLSPPTVVPVLLWAT
jgi:hypothetical protein